MDPDAVLAEALEALARFNPDTPPGENVDNDDDARIIIERFQSINTWVANGGYLPDAWKPAERPDDEQVIRVIYTVADVKEVAADNDVDFGTAIERAREWGKHIANTATMLCSEQLESCILVNQP